jgi:hypothetical protein
MGLFNGEYNMFPSVQLGRMTQISNAMALRPIQVHESEGLVTSR